MRLGAGRVARGTLGGNPARIVALVGGWSRGRPGRLRLACQIGLNRSASRSMRPLNELINETEPALPLVHDWIAGAAIQCEILPPSPRNDDVLLALQVTTRSPMGAIAHGSGGLLLDGGWLRVLGSGHPRLPRDLAGWNAGRADGFLLVADDAAGGFFALNGGALGDDPGMLYYRAPDNLQWEALELGYSDFLQAMLAGRIEDFYAALRWPEWQAEVKALGPDQCFSFYPFLWTQEGSPAASSRKAVDIAEHCALTLGVDVGH
ncbi:hypothetical protein LMG26691_00300 [Achromobacter animicus]|nr:hypothetical protein LMG26691_00300 [Achromobacter animicus]